MSDITRYAGFAEETSFNSATVPAEKFHVDIASAGIDIPAAKNVTVPGGLGKGPKRKVNTFHYPTGAVEYAVDLNTIGFFLKMTLGGYEFTDQITTGGTVNKHEFYGDKNAIPKSFITTVGKDKFEHLFTGCVVESMDINVSDSVITATVNIVGAKAQRRVIKLESELNIPDQYPLAMHEVTASIGAQNISTKVQNLSVSISNNASADAGKVIGQLHPARIVTGERTVDVSYTLYFEDETELVRYENDEEFTLDIDFTQMNGESMNIHLPKAYYDAVPTTVSGRDMITQSATVKTLIDTVTITGDGTSTGSTVESNILVTLNNTEGGY